MRTLVAAALLAAAALSGTLSGTSQASGAPGCLTAFLEMQRHPSPVERDPQDGSVHVYPNRATYAVGVLVTDTYKFADCVV